MTGIIQLKISGARKLFTTRSCDRPTGRLRSFSSGTETRRSRRDYRQSDRPTGRLRSFSSGTETRRSRRDVVTVPWSHTHTQPQASRVLLLWSHWTEACLN
ncbi:hypothetical protein RRG08_052286 [Elysia crispata]|uniref:Uncharacterized protein n=1 Tax=Elysia crispata TaxID=231223 RepID=A0AAE1DPJ5_9GAST|nr:hypothetical protein RRG08_052286 [Elysia crispata]